MNVLVVGSGAREHALLWKLRQSRRIDALLAAPGNAGTEAVAENVPVAAGDLESLVRLVQERDVGLTVVGPEAPLVAGLADRLRAVGRRVVGPSADAARIEGSKAFAKELMVSAGIPTAPFVICTDAVAAVRHVEAWHSYPLAIKADGPAAGKGVWVCGDESEARAAVHAMMVERRYGSAGDRIVIEDGLRGPEVSLIALVDGSRSVALPPAQDHKRLLAGDRGPNTGGMGAYAPVPFLTDVDCEDLFRLAIEPIVAEMADRGTPYRGILFAGLMLTEAGPRVLEYNCRLGDPEAQVILALLQDELLPWLEGIVEGTLPAGSPAWTGAATGVVLAAPGYPGRPESGAEIHGLHQASGVHVFHAGTTRDAGGRIRTSGGRVLTVVGVGESIAEATGRAYGAPVYFEGMQSRDDIGRATIEASHAHAGFEVGGRTRVAPTRSPEVHRVSGNEQARIVVLASGGGTNLQALIDACRTEEIDAQVVLVASHRRDAGALRRSEAAGIPGRMLPLRDVRDRDARARLEEELLAHLRRVEPDLVVLAGWMLILSPRFLRACPCPVLNVHPALLPDGRELLDVPVIRGAHAVRDALRLRLPYTGVSIHYVTDEVDAGPVVAREVVPIRADDDEESLYRRIKPVEHRLLVAAVRQVLDGRRQKFPILPGGVHA